eukprot:scaffold238579_cov33-Tisochrysis_lutea.AAC.2
MQYGRIAIKGGEGVRQESCASNAKLPGAVANRCNVRSPDPRLSKGVHWPGLISWRDCAATARAERMVMSGPSQAFRARRQMEDGQEQRSNGMRAFLAVCRDRHGALKLLRTLSHRHMVVLHFKSQTPSGSSGQYAGQGSGGGARGGAGGSGDGGGGGGGGDGYCLGGGGGGFGHGFSAGGPTSHGSHRSSESIG